MFDISLWALLVWTITASVAIGGAIAVSVFRLHIKCCEATKNMDLGTGIHNLGVATNQLDLLLRSLNAIPPFTRLKLLKEGPIWACQP